MKRNIVVARGKKIRSKVEQKLKKRPGGSNTGKYKTVKVKDFAGKLGGTSPYSFPMDTIARARNALARAHYAPDPAGIRRAVYKKYPQLKNRANKRKMS